MQKWALSAVLICLLPSSAISGPDKTTTHLMNESATMLDFGMLRLSLFLDEYETSVRYIWDENRIQLVRNFHQYADKDLAEESCSQWVTKMRRMAMINTDTGKPYQENSVFANVFSHFGFTSSKTPEGLYQDIDILFQLTCYASIEGGGSLIVSAPLLGANYSLER
jgi:hypothetical protein